MKPESQIGTAARGKLAGVAGLVLLSALAGQAQAADGAPVPASAASRAQEAYGKLPLYFEANQGQTDGQVKFLARGPGYSLFLTPTEAVLTLRAQARGEGHGAMGKAEVETKAEAQQAVLRLKLIGANSSPTLAGQDELPGKANYFIGNDPAKWRANVPLYGKVQYQHVYPGVDLVYYGHQRQLEYDLIVAPGADPSAIRFAVEGAETVEVDAGGDLVVTLPTTNSPITAPPALLLKKPVVYQEITGHKQLLAGSYVLKGRGSVSFQITAYDPTKPLIIDPVLSYSTYLGATDNIYGLAVDGTGNAFVTGAAGVFSFPLTIPTPRPFSGGHYDSYVAKLNPTGSALVYSTYLGGNGNEHDDNGIVVDGSGAAYVTGDTTSTNFPTTAGAVQPTYGGSAEGFVTKLALPAVAPGPVCDIQMNQVMYVNGDTVIAQTLRLTTNSGTPPVPIELKIWLGVPTTPPIFFSFANFGADGSRQLPPGFDQNFGPVTLFTVSSGLPRGT